MDIHPLDLLKSEKPSQRSRAIDQLQRDATPADLPTLREALHGESVPMLRRQLSNLVRRLSNPIVEAPAQVTALGSADEMKRFEDDTVRWLRHELEPSIGWLALAASDEIKDFEASETRLAIDGLSLRLDGVEALVRASAPPRYEKLSLSEIVLEAIQMSGASKHRLTTDLVRDRPDDITTDGNLMRMALSNAIRNAIDAVLEVPKEASHVHVSADVTPSSFWVKVSNQFVGSEFYIDDISGSGVTSKIGHQGQGLNIMRMIAARLRYDILIQAEAGLAIFTLRGRRGIG